MSEPTAELNALRASTAVLVQELHSAMWNDAEVAAPSLCPGWTRGHVLTHLARNADGISQTLAGALRGEIVARYPGGGAARDAAIDAGAARPFAELAADVRDSAERLDRMWGALSDADAWNQPTDEDSPAHRWVLRRWREVEIHHVDLDAGYTPDRWPPLFVVEALPAAAETLAARAGRPLRVEVIAEASLAPDLVGRSWTTSGSAEPVDVRGPDWALLAWLTGRGAALPDGVLTASPELQPWR